MFAPLNLCLCMWSAVGITGGSDSLFALPAPGGAAGCFRPVGMSTDGLAIGGNFTPAGAMGVQPVIWQKSSGTTAMRVPSTAAWARLVGLVSDGATAVVATDSSTGVAFVRWESGSAEAPQTIGGGGVMACTALSADGRVIAGSMPAPGVERVAATYDAERGLIEVPHPMYTVRTECIGIDRTGARVLANAVFQTGHERPFVYSADEGLVDLWGLAADVPATAGAISASGRYIAGSMGGEPGAVRPYRWSDAQGAIELATPWGENVFATHISGDGSLIAGTRGPAADSHAWIWTQAGGARDLAELLADRGVSTQGWTLESIGAVSRDGTTIAGVGVRNGNRSGWVANLASQRCGAADLTGPGGWPGGDGLLTADDIVMFLSAYFSGDSAADVAALGGVNRADGVVTTDDVAAFLAAFFAGCP